MEELRQFLLKRPALKLHYEHEGSVSDYARHVQARVPKANGHRLTDIILEHARKLMPNGHVVPPLLANQLRGTPVISFADHASLLNHGILYNANLLFSAIMDRQALPYQVVLPTGRIPLNNASYPRGFFFKGQKIPFFMSKVQHTITSLLSEGIAHPDGRRLDSFIRPDSLKGLSAQEKLFLEYLFLDELKLASACNDHTRFVEQLPTLNARLWNCYFERSFRTSVPKLIYLNADDIVKELLLDELRNPDSLTSRILTNPTIRDIYLEEFTGISGCWSGESGTHFFWGVSPKKTLIPLNIDKHFGTLEFSHFDPEMQPIPMTCEDLSEALRENRIIPSLFLDIFLLAFVEGFTLLGGFNQVTYMAWMRVAHERCALRMGDWPSAAKFARTVTDGLICGLMPFEWNSGIDLIWERNSINGTFNGNLDNGLSRSEMDEMVNKPIKTMLQNSVRHLIDLIE